MQASGLVRISKKINFVEISLKKKKNRSVVCKKKIDFCMPDRCSNSSLDSSGNCGNKQQTFPEKKHK